MSNQTIKSFSVVGIAVRTTNENGQSGNDMAALWGKFITGAIAGAIPNKVDATVYCIYTDYERDHTAPYTAILGCKVSNLDLVPVGMVGRTFQEANYATFTARGSIMQGAVYNEWVKIWNTDLARTYTADFEVYGPGAQDLEAAEIDIFVGVE